MISSLESFFFFNTELYGKTNSHFLKKFLRLPYFFSRYNKSCFLGKQIALGVGCCFFGRYAKKKKRKCNTKLCNSVLNLLKKDKGKESVRSKRLKAGWNNDFLQQLITNYNAFFLARNMLLRSKLIIFAGYGISFCHYSLIQRFWFYF
jgi:hypothetical protein